MNNQSAKLMHHRPISFRHWIGIVFTLFSLYLLGDVFYRWDAYKFHSSIFEFLPNVALAFILWSFVAFIGTVVIWLLLRVFVQLAGYLKLQVSAEHMVIYLCFFMLLTAMTWTGKKIVLSDLQTTLHVKLFVLLSVTCLAIPLTWLLRNKANLCVNTVREHISPLVWLFTVCLLLSLSLVGFHMWSKNTGNELSQRIMESTVSESDKKRPNILLVTFDALTARNMSLYGYHRETTPFLKKWAESASLFTRVEAESSYTAATTPSLMTGKRTWTHRKYHHDLAAKPLKSKTENIALVMKENGYFNSVFMANIVSPVSALGISSSVDHAPPVIEFSSPGSIEGLIEKYLFILFGDTFSTYNWLGQDDFIFTLLLRRIDKKVFETEFPPELVMNKFLEGMDNNTIREPFLAWIHVMPPHAPYAPPSPFAGTFNSSWELREKNKMYRYNPEINKYSSQNLPFPEALKAKVALLRDYYDEFILYCDNQFENFIGELNKRNWAKNTVIILSSDHGESFEHNYFQHGPVHLFEQVTHIPLIIKEPGQTDGRVIHDLVEQIDIPATILDLAKIPVPSWMEGRTLVPLMRDRKLPAKIAISVSLYNSTPTDPITTGIIAVWEGDYKLIHYLSSERSLLFNLKEDPDETHNLFSEELILGNRLLRLVQKNLKQANERIMREM